MTPEILGRILRRDDIQPLERLIDNPEDLRDVVKRLRDVGYRISMTSGSFDLVHIGHARYLAEAKARGDILIVALEDDEKTQKRKGENRPVVPFSERAEMMGHLRYVDLVATKKVSFEKFALVDIIRPDVLVVVSGTYPNDEPPVELKALCQRIDILPRQAETSTSAKVRRVELGGAEELAKRVLPIIQTGLPKMVEEAIKQAREEMKGGSSA